MRSKVAASTASMLTVTRLRPAALSGSASESSKWPFVVSARSSGSSQSVRRRRELSDQIEQAVAKKRLAAGETNFCDAEIDEEADEAQILVDGQLGILRADFAGAAVDAFVIATVGDGDAQIVDGSAVAVGETLLN